MDPTLTRRGVLVGGGVCALALCGLTGCASYGPESEPHGSATPAAEMTAPAAAIPVGGGKIYTDEKIVITQPSAAVFEAFSAICTHQGCVVGAVTTTIDCPCHGSKFSITDGSVVHGPATAPLPRLKASVDGRDVKVG